MSYPSLEQYQEALQHPRTALLDPELRAGKIATTNLGLPLVMCGGFALTYTVSAAGRRYAVRCFHKQSPDLERRYRAISAKLIQMASAYFLPFEFQAQGVRIAGNTYPVVKMAWANGDTLGDFVADNHRNPAALATLRNCLKALASYLEIQQLAHGDIQPGNLMIADGGASIQLIDYDGMFVPAIQALGAAEIGHRNFQHPRRTSQEFGSTLDRFSLICTTVALHALEVDSTLWDQTQSDSDAFLFRASDFSDPGASAIFHRLMAQSSLAPETKALAAVCLGDVGETPSLGDFLAGKGIPRRQIIVAASPVRPAIYTSQYTVLDASNYAAFLQNVGSMAELIGMVTDVKHGYMKNGRGSYIFINFGNWRGHIVKLTIWSHAMSRLKDHVSSALVGSWVSVVGLVEPAYVNPKFGYSHISIDLTSPNQMRVISPAEAAFRLGVGTHGQSAPIGNRNQAPERRISGGASSTRGSSVDGGPRATGGSMSRNAAILQNMQKTQRTRPSPLPTRPPPPPPTPVAPSQQAAVKTPTNTLWSRFMDLWKK